MLKKKSDNVLPERDDIPGVEDLALELNIDNDARRRGRLNQPDPEATEPDEVESRVHNRINHMAMRHFKRSEEAVGRLRDDINNIFLTPQLEAAEGILPEMSFSLETFKKQAVRILSQVRQARDRAADDYDDFRKQHRLTRAASYPDSFWLVGGWLFLILLIETTLNGFSFAEGSDLGLLGGWMEAFVIACINVLLGFFAAGKVWRQLHFHRTSRRLLAGAVVMMLFVIAIVFNLLVGHYRAAFVENPDIAGEIGLENFLANPLNVGDVNSWFLVLLGLLFFVFAVHKGLHADDVYPGYGKVSRLREKSEDELQSQSEEVRETIDSIYDDAINKLDELNAKAKRLNDHLHANSRQIDMIARQHRDACIQYEELCAQTIRRYREKNMEIRNQPQPAYFDSNIDASVKALQVDTNYQDKRAEFQEQKHKLDVRVHTIKNELQDLRLRYANDIMETAGQ